MKEKDTLVQIISELDQTHQSYIYEYLMGHITTVTNTNNNYKFHTPNSLLKYRANTFFTKEPETIEWIDNYVDGVFWDIGANIGLYSIYAAKKDKDITVYSFEPSSTNIYTLTKNIILNECSRNIKVITMPLTNSSGFQKLNLQNMEEGNALNAFGVNYDYNGDEFNSECSYFTYGTSIAHLIDKFDLEMPNHIKIDVDGIEHQILEGGENILDDDAVRTIQLEINEDFVAQKEKILRFMDNHNFKIVHRKQGPEFVGSKYQMMFNYLFEKSIV